jgi:hypothetical protein
VEFIRNKCVDVIKRKIRFEEKAPVVSKDNLIFKGNYKCHLNCLSYAVKHSEKVKSIVGGVQVFSDDVVAHFIIELNTGEFIDVTYGNLAYLLYEDFVIVERYDWQQFDAGQELMNMKDHIYYMLPLYLRLFTKNTDF